MTGTRLLLVALITLVPGAATAGAGGFGEVSVGYVSPVGGDAYMDNFRSGHVRVGARGGWAAAISRQLAVGGELVVDWRQMRVTFDGDVQDVRALAGARLSWFGQAGELYTRAAIGVDHLSTQYGSDDSILVAEPAVGAVYRSDRVRVGIEMSLSLSSRGENQYGDEIVAGYTRVELQLTTSIGRAF